MSFRKFIYGLTFVLGCICAQAETNPKPAPSFRLDVEPVLMRAGCNTGACHGSARGQDGFRLSLFGFDPAGDYYRITREYPGRRIDLVEPEKSLLLEKSIGAVTHTGGELFKKGSVYYNTIRDWIAAGAKDDAPGTPEVTGIKLTPEKISVRKSTKAPTLKTKVTASYSDGSERDVTHLALFMSNNDSVATIDKNGVAKAGNSGGAFVFARYAKFTVGSEMIVLPENPTFAWPEDAKPNNYVDETVFARLKQLQIQPSALAGDEVFLRRASLDLTGLPPDEALTREFLADQSPDKRARVIDRFLASSEFTDLWTMKWAEILQIRVNANNPDYGRSRKAVYKYYHWLRDQIAQNRPFNQIVKELVVSNGSNLDTPQANFYTTAVGNKRTALERAEDVAQLFLGSRIQCAQCHNHPFDRWTMDDYFGFTAFFTGVESKRGATTAEVFVFNRNEKASIDHPVDGRAMKPRFLGGDQPALNGADPRVALAEWLTSPDNLPFANSLANRAWNHFFGRGIIEPVDDARISNPPSNAALLDGLSQRLIKSNFNIRQLVRDICNSRTYQLSSTVNETNAMDDRCFSRAYVRRLQAEVLLDTIGKVTGSPTTFGGQITGTRAVQIFDGGAEKDVFLKNFGASKRETVCACEVRMEPTLTQTLALINGEQLERGMQRSPFLQEINLPEITPEQAVERIYMRALSRQPSAPEVSNLTGSAAGLNWKEASVRKQFLEDVLWSVMNTTEFSFNH
jgi:hypothetical protein